jgi:hypothetical protein
MLNIRANYHQQQKRQEQQGTVACCFVRDAADSSTRCIATIITCVQLRR